MLPSSSPLTHRQDAYSTLTLEQSIDREFLVVSPDTLVLDAIATMSQAQASCVLIVEQQRLVGIFTERDVVRLIASKMPLAEMAVVQVMTKQPITLASTPTPDICSVLPLLRQHRIRHLPIIDEQEQPVGVFTAYNLEPVVDALINKNQALEDELIENENAWKLSQERLESILGSLDDVVWSFNPQISKLLYLNSATEQVYGRRIEEFFQNLNLWQEVVHPEDCTKLETANRVLRETGSKDIDYRILRPDGEVRWIRDRAHVIYDANGLPIRIDSMMTDISNVYRYATQRQEVEKALRESEEKFRQLAETIHEVFFVYPLDYSELLYISPAYEQVWGRSCESLYQQPTSWLETVHPEDRNLLHQALQRQYEGEGFNQEYRILRPDGSLCWIFARTFILNNEAGQPYRVVGVAEDITERKQAELDLQQLNQELDNRVRLRTQELEHSQAILRESEAKFRQLAQTINEAFFLESLDGQQMLYISPAYERIWGRTCQSLYEQSTSWLDAIYAEDRDRILMAFQEQIRNQRNFSGEYRIIRPDGVIRWISVRTSLVCNDAGQPYRVAGIAQDITERQLAEQELEKSQRFIQRIAEASPSILYIYDLEEQRNIYVNREIAIILGYTPVDIEAMGSKVLLTLIHPDDWTQVCKNLVQIQAATDGQILEFEYRMKHANGEWHWIYSRETVFARTASGAVKQIIGTASDISDRKRTEAFLRENEERFRAIFEQAAVGMSRVTLCGQFLQVNQRFCDLTGYTQAELLARTFSEITHPDDREADLALVHQLVSGKISSFSLEKRFIRKDGLTQWVNLTVSPVRDAEGAIKYNIGVIEDISHIYEELRLRQQAEEQLKASLAEKELLLREIHHRVKNNLNVVHSLLNMQSRLVPDEALKNVLIDSQKRLQTMALIHEQLYQSKSFGKIDFAEYIHRLVKNLFAASNLNHDLITLDIQSEPVELNLETAIPTGLIINELLTNALKHAFKGRQSGRVCVNFYQTSDQKLHLIVSDNGVGLPSDSNGNGQKAPSLGMRLVQILVQQLRATFDVVRCNGTSFQLTFTQIE